MPVVLTTFAPNRETYEAINDKIGVLSDLPSGLIIHTATQTPDGVKIVDVWESKEAADTFHRDRLGPAIEAVSGGMVGGEPDIAEPFNVIRP